jgi:hypothetical protein
MTRSIDPPEPAPARVGRSVVELLFMNDVARRTIPAAGGLVHGGAAAVASSAVSHCAVPRTLTRCIYEGSSPQRAMACTLAVVSYSDPRPGCF